MNPTLRLRCALALLCLVVVTLSGCSGGTALGPLASGSSVAPAQVAAAIFVQQWAQILWGLVANQTGTQSPVFGEPVFEPDGSLVQTFTGADGTQAVMTAYPDGSIVLSLTYPNGATQTAKQSVPEYDWVSKTTIDWQITSSDGLTVSYRSVVDDQGTMFDMWDDTTQLLSLAEIRKCLSVARGPSRTTRHPRLFPYFCEAQ